MNALEVYRELPKHIQKRIKFCRETGCWITQGDPSSNGYQRVWYYGKRVMAHKLTYQLKTGTIARTREHDHLCENIACCNPDHIQLVTPSQNCKRRKNRKKTVTRPLLDDWAMGIAMQTATRTTCLRRQVGCLLLDSHGHEMASGYNGVARDAPHCNERAPDNLRTIPDCDKQELIYPNACPGAFDPSGRRSGVCHALHAEWNALLKCRDINAIETCYVTLSPCLVCINMLLNTSCKRIVFYQLYSDTTPLERWVANGRIWEQWHCKT